MAKKKSYLSESEKKRYVQEVWRINKQLQRLEAKYQKTGKNIWETAYKGIIRDIESIYGTGARRFRDSEMWMPTTRRQYMKRMNMIRRFYEKPSSTIHGMRAVYEKRANTWSKRMNAKITPELMMKVFETGLYKELTDAFGSKTALKKLGFILRQKDRIMKLMEKGEKIYFLGTGAKELNDIINSPEFNLDSALRNFYEGASD